MSVHGPSLIREELRGARWSSAVRCVARAEHEAVGSKRDEQAQTFLQDFFVRGVSAAEAWVDRQLVLADAAGKTLIAEMAIPWGPPELGWLGHADAVILPDNLVVEAYHSVGASFRREKALQAAGYAKWLSEDDEGLLREDGPYQAMLAVLDTTDVHEDTGFAVTYYPIEVASFADEVDDIAGRVEAAARLGTWNPEDRVADTPAHQECRSCPFREVCWEGYVPEVPQFHPELDDLASKLVTLQAQRGHLRAELDAADSEIAVVREELRPFMPVGREVIAAGVSIKRIEVAPRTTFKFSAYEGAGHLITPTMREFISQGRDGERWYVRARGSA